MTDPTVEIRIDDLRGLEVGVEQFGLRIHARHQRQAGAAQRTGRMRQREPRLGLALRRDRVLEIEDQRLRAALARAREEARLEHRHEQRTTNAVGVHRRLLSRR